MGVTPTPSEARHEELADFLRSRREGVSPESVGIEPNGRRRTPGLRREELAELAGVGLSWYTWLEQGRDINPSPQVLDALARVLGLESAERAHLYHLARVEIPLSVGGYPREAPPELAALVRALSPHPAWLTNPCADVLAWSEPVRALHDFDSMPAERRNILWWLFGDYEWGDTWEDTARRNLARFRSEYARRPDDERFRTLVADLSEASAEFHAWWPRHDVLAEQGGTKTIHRARLGTLRLHHLQTIPTTHPELRLTLYAPADEATAGLLRELF